MYTGSISEESVRLAADALLKGVSPASSSTPAAGGIDTTTLISGFPLQAGLKVLVPTLSPFRQYLPRTVIDGGTSINWKAVTAISPPYPFVAEGNPGSRTTQTVAEKQATYKIMSHGGWVTREAIAASQGFEPALQFETAKVLLFALQQESRMMMYGTTTALGAAPTNLTLTVSTATGTLSPAPATYYAQVLALTYKGFIGSGLTVTPTGNADPTTPTEAPTTVAATTFGVAMNVAGSGATQLSAEANSGALTATLKCLNLAWDAIPGAYAYVLFVGTTTGVANLKCIGCFTTTKVSIANLPTTGTAASSGNVPVSDRTADATAYDGIFQQLSSSTAGYFKDLKSGLTGSGGEITAIQDCFAALWDGPKLKRFRLVVSGRDARKLTGLTVGAGGGPTIFVDANGSDRGSLTQGYHAGAIYNAVTGEVCPIDVEPWIPQGTMLIFPTEIWYPNANVPSVFDWCGGYDWSRFDYPMTPTTGYARTYPFETAAYGVVRVLFPGGCGVITGILPG
jgi:hypothetical protein